MSTRALCAVEEKRKEALEGLHAKQLLNMLHSSYLSGSCECCSAFLDCCKVEENNRALIKEVLKTRPHVLNKIESKNLRKLRKKRGYK